MSFFARHGQLAGAHHAALLIALVPIFAIGLEALVVMHRGGDYRWREVGASVVVAFVQRIASVLSAFALSPLFALLATHRLLTIHLAWPYEVFVAFVLVEFAYYWMHRASHTVGWMWATHSVHHSAEQLNLPAAIRLGGTGALSLEWLPFVPLVVIGIAPSTIGALLAANLAYQFFLHTELIPRLGPLEGIFNTPSAHRVHHAINANYLDRNFGGVLVVFDRFFGTYVPECAENPPRYGLIGECRGSNPLHILADGWIRLTRAVARARSFGGGLEALVRLP
jgi:sterol desaturase/sphingolipid hydroxylase (fatty acid hydroxylase superfamily)